MCGIVCAFDLKQKSEILRPLVLQMSKKIRHRGPDWSGIYSDNKTIMAHERLAIVDPASGKQPLFSLDRKLILAANGEIITARLLGMSFKKTHHPKKKSSVQNPVNTLQTHPSRFKRSFSLGWSFPGS